MAVKTREARPRVTIVVLVVAADMARVASGRYAGKFPHTPVWGIIAIVTVAVRRNRGPRPFARSLAKRRAPIDRGDRDLSFEVGFFRIPRGFGMSIFTPSKGGKGQKADYDRRNFREPDCTGIWTPK